MHKLHKSDHIVSILKKTKKMQTSCTPHISSTNPYNRSLSSYVQVHKYAYIIRFINKNTWMFIHRGLSSHCRIAGSSYTHQLHYIIGHRAYACNTLKISILKIGLKWFIYEFLCTWNVGKRIFFIILKFIIRSSNMYVHTCQCIWFIAMSG